MRLFFALGPGNIVADARPDPNVSRGETSITFSNQISRLMRMRGIEGVMVSSNSAKDFFNNDGLTLKNIPRIGEKSSGIFYHISRVFYGARLAFIARRQKSDLAIIDSGSAHYFSLALFPLLGIPVAVNFHNVRWPSGFEPQGAPQRLIRRFDSWFFRHVAIGATGCSPECALQARADGAGALPYFGWNGQFDTLGFEAPGAMMPQANEFRLLFAGRIEANKGVFDLLKMAEMLRGQGGRPILIEICGDGSALEAVRDEVARAGLQDCVTVRGRLERTDLLEAYRRCDAVIVPTRGNFCEGMPLVCAEAMLSGKPVVTSRLSNALPVIGEAIVEAEPEDIESYVRAIRSLADDPALYASRQAACHTASQQFLDRSTSYAAATDRLLAHIFPGHRPLDDYDPLFA